MQHLASIDFEDWYYDVERVYPVDDDAFRRAFDRQLSRIVDIFAKTGTKATFFVLGKSAERHEGWVRDLAAAGHDIATHGYGHDKLPSLTPELFRADLVRSLDVIERITGKRPVGYRAPYFAMSAKEAAWLYDVLADEGITYSSSISPGRRTSFTGHALGPTSKRTRSGKDVLEIPVATVEWRGLRLPIAGGGFWRALPLPIIERGIRALEREGRGMVLYLHPHELDPEALHSHRGRRRDLFVNLGRRSVGDKLRAVLDTFAFRPFAAGLPTP